MDLKLRRIIYINFIIAFLIAATLLIIYAKGFRYDFEKHKLIRTGSLVIKSLPNEAKIYLDGNLQKNQTDTIVKHISPNDYWVEIKKPKYQAWQKKISIYPHQSSFTGIIKLWPKNVTPKIILENVTKIQFSQNQEQIAYYTTDKQAKAQNFSDSSEIFEIDGLTGNFSWSTNGRKILSINDGIVINAQESGRTINLNQLFSLGFTDLKWAPNSDNILYGINNNTLYGINLATIRANQLFQDKIIDYKIKDKSIYYLTAQNKNIILKIFNLENQTTKIFPNEKVAYSRNIYFNQFTSDLISILDSDNDYLYLIDSPLKKFRQSTQIITQVQGIQWHGDDLLYYNNFELWLMNIRNNKKQLLARFSEEINEAIFYDENYIVFSSKNNIKAIEIDSREPRNIWTIFKSENIISKIELSNDKEKIYLISNNILQSINLK